jgi:hypothetical protein
MINVNWADVVGGSVILAVASLAYLGWCWVQTARVKLADRQTREAWEADMATMADLARRKPASYDGDTYAIVPADTPPLGYDWDEKSLDFLARANDPGWVVTGEFPALPKIPVPPSNISGPLPAFATARPAAPPSYDADADAAEFLRKMREDNAAFLAKIRGDA